MANDDDFDINSNDYETVLYEAEIIQLWDCNGQVKQDTLLSRLFIKFSLLLGRGLIAQF
jgi:hypothetical protein